MLKFKREPKKLDMKGTPMIETTLSIPPAAGLALACAVGLGSVLRGNLENEFTKTAAGILIFGLFMSIFMAMGEISDADAHHRAAVDEQKVLSTKPVKNAPNSNQRGPNEKNVPAAIGSHG